MCCKMRSGPFRTSSRTPPAATCSASQRPMPAFRAAATSSRMASLSTPAADRAQFEQPLYGLLLRQPRDRTPQDSGQPFLVPCHRASSVSCGRCSGPIAPGRTPPRCRAGRAPPRSRVDAEHRPDVGAPVPGPGAPRIRRGPAAARGRCVRVAARVVCRS